MKALCWIHRLVVVSVLAGVLLIALPGAAVAVFQLTGTVTQPSPTRPLENVQLCLYEETAAGWVVRWEGENWALPTGSYEVTATDIGTGAYTLRITRPGFVTQTRVFPTGATGVLDFMMGPDPQPTERLAGSDRYSTAVRVAREHFTSPTHPTSWWGVNTVVIVSGEDRAAADPLAAAGLCAVYRDAPLFLVSSASVPSSVKQAIREINTTYHTTRIVVVGGSVSVPDERLMEIVAAAPNDVILDRIVASGDRFDLAAAIAGRMADVRGIPNYHFLVANGADSDKFFDALALSPVSASDGYPLLLVTQDSVPAVTRDALDEGFRVSGKPGIFVGGGPATVSDEVVAQLDQRYGDVQRWAGADRYRTAQVIADKAIAYGDLDGDIVGVAAKLPDALTGGATIGRSEGVLLITNGEHLTSSTGSWLNGHKADIDKCYTIGGTRSIMPGVHNAIESKLR